MNEILRQVITNLRANKLRSLLTMFGILWGVVSVVVLSATSVHSFGLRRGLDLIGVDDQMRVVATMPLPPNRVRVIPSARLIVELPPGWPLPEIGEQIEITYG